MPEAPEVQVVVNTLKPYLIGRTLGMLEVMDTVILNKYDDIPSFQAKIRGGMVTDISRRGKYILIDLVYEDGREPHVLICHLAMTGAILVVMSDTLLNGVTDAMYKGIYARIYTESKNGERQPYSFAFSDYRKFGSLKCVPKSALSKSKKELPSHLHGLITLGSDPLNHPEDVKFFLHELRKDKYQDKPIKDVLLDQSVIAGVGNIYANEVCYAMGVMPTRPVGDLNELFLSKLYSKLHEILARSVELGGSSIKDFVNAEGIRGQSQEELLTTYNKEYCEEGHIMQVGYIKSKVTYYCPLCQR